VGDSRFYLAIGVPIVANFAAIFLGVTLLSRQLRGVNTRIDNLRMEMIARFESLGKFLSENSAAR
jgi:hypothetical protein